MRPIKLRPDFSDILADTQTLMLFQYWCFTSHDINPSHDDPRADLSWNRD